MSDLVYNTTMRGHSRIVRRDPHDPERLEGFAFDDDTITAMGAVSAPATFCRPHPRAHLFGPSPGAYRFAERMGGGKSSRWDNPPGRFAHGALEVGRKRLVNKEAVRRLPSTKED